ncbi:hypothetical protein D3C73_1641900 [compost metagenome]
MDAKIECRLQFFHTTHMVAVMVSDQYIGERPTGMFFQPSLNGSGIAWIYNCTGLA